jgi:hypothetical protein
MLEDWANHAIITHTTHEITYPNYQPPVAQIRKPMAQIRKPIVFDRLEVIEFEQDHPGFTTPTHIIECLLDRNHV